MRTGVAGAASARSLKVCGDDTGSSSQLLKFRQQEFAVRARRRAFALSASIEDVLVAAADRASDRLKRERPEFSAATLNKLAYFIPSLFGVGALAALLTSVTTIVLCALAVLPAAFRILVVVSPTQGPRRAVFRNRARSTAHLHRHRSSSPRGAGSGPIAVSHRTARLSSRETRRDRHRRGRRAGNPRRNHATQTPSPDHGGSGATGRATHETQSAQYCAGARARLIRRDLRCGGPAGITPASSFALHMSASDPKRTSGAMHVTAQ